MAMQTRRATCQVCCLLVALCLTGLVEAQASRSAADAAASSSPSPVASPSPATRVEAAGHQRHGPYPDGIETLPTGWAIAIALAIVGGAAAATALWLRRQRHSASQPHRPIDDDAMQGVEVV